MVSGNQLMWVYIPKERSKQPISEGDFKELNSRDSRDLVDENGDFKKTNLPRQLELFTKLNGLFIF
jgi:hypothetical protein